MQAEPVLHTEDGTTLRFVRRAGVPILQQFWLTRAYDQNGHSIADFARNEWRDVPLVEEIANANGEGYIPVLGKTVVSCCKTQDSNGYDILHIIFGDNSGLVVREEGQAGHFSVKMLKAGFATGANLGKDGGSDASR